MGLASTMTSSMSSRAEDWGRYPFDRGSHPKLPEAIATLPPLGASERIPPVSAPSISQHRCEELSPSLTSPCHSSYSQVPKVTTVPASHPQSLAGLPGKARFHLLRVSGYIILWVCCGTCNFPRYQLTVNSLELHRKYLTILCAHSSSTVWGKIK